MQGVPEGAKIFSAMEELVLRDDKTRLCYERNAGLGDPSPLWGIHPMFGRAHFRVYTRSH